jgi:hypothetical protein
VRNYKICIFLNFQLAGYAFVLQGNEYRKMPFRLLRTKFCDIVKRNKSFYEDGAAVSNFPPTLGCPVWPKVIYFFSSFISIDSFIFLFVCFQGHYTVTNYILDMSMSSIPKNFDGRFKVGFLFYYLQQPIDSGFLYVELRNFD